MTNPESLSLRRRLALEIGRKLYQQKVKEHPLRRTLLGVYPALQPALPPLREATAR